MLLILKVEKPCYTSNSKDKDRLFKFCYFAVDVRRIMLEMGFNTLWKKPSMRAAFFCLNPLKNTSIFDFKRISTINRYKPSH